MYYKHKVSQVSVVTHKSYICINHIDVTYSDTMVTKNTMVGKSAPLTVGEKMADPETQ